MQCFLVPLTHEFLPRWAPCDVLRQPFLTRTTRKFETGLGAMLRFLLQITSLKQGDVLSLQFRAAKVKFQTLLLTSEIPL